MIFVHMTPRSAAVALAIGLLLGGCASSNGAPGLAAADQQSHTTATSGFGLGPENFNSNGGAFGPDQLEH